ncbi:MAG TPA: hypothetical protein VMF50_16570, partial [Candidatus Binataceae bacterium]|nr:hypothetical protein [Candidatus Binataceae bacterium]
ITIGQLLNYSQYLKGFLGYGISTNLPKTRPATRSASACGASAKGYERLTIALILPAVKSCVSAAAISWITEPALTRLIP